MSPAHPDSIAAKRMVYADNGPYKVVIAKGQRAGAKTVAYQIHGANGARWGTVASHQRAVDLVKELNEAFALWLMVRGTAAEKEHFP